MVLIRLFAKPFRECRIDFIRFQSHCLINFLIFCHLQKSFTFSIASCERRFNLHLPESRKRADKTSRRWQGPTEGTGWVFSQSVSDIPFCSTLSERGYLHNILSETPKKYKKVPFACIFLYCTFYFYCSAVQ